MKKPATFTFDAETIDRLDEMNYLTKINKSELIRSLINGWYEKNKSDFPKFEVAKKALNW